MDDILYVGEEQQPSTLHVPSSRNDKHHTSTLIEESFSQATTTCNHANSVPTYYHQQQQPAVAEAATATHLDHLLDTTAAVLTGEQGDVDDVVRCFTAADALEVFEEFAYGTVPPLRDTAVAGVVGSVAEELSYAEEDPLPLPVPSSLAGVVADASNITEESPKGVNATLDPAIFDKFPRTTSLISLSPSPDQIASGLSSDKSSSSSSSSSSSITSSSDVSPIVVSDVDIDSNHSSFADTSSIAVGLPPFGYHPNVVSAAPDYNFDVMDDLTSAAAAIEHQASGDYQVEASGSAALYAAAATNAAAKSAPSSSSSRGKGSKKKASTAATATTSATTGGGERFKPFHEEKWDQKLTELIEFRQSHGHTLVPHTYEPNPQLARWVKRQRRQYKLMQGGKTSTMTPARVAILEEAGFVWDSHEVSWREKVQELVQYREKFGDCLVPSSYRDNPQLATWVKCQRRQYKLYWEGKPSGMTPKRIEELDRLGFCWEIGHNNKHVYGSPPSSRKRSAGGGSGDEGSASGRASKRSRKVAKRDSLDLLGEAASMM